MRGEIVLTREVAKLQHRIIRVVDSRNDIRSAESDLFRLGEVVGGVLVESHFSHPLDRHQLLWNPFRAIEDVEIEGKFLLFSDELNSKVPLGVSSSFDGAVSKGKRNVSTVIERSMESQMAKGGVRTLRDHDEDNPDRVLEA